MSISVTGFKSRKNIFSTHDNKIKLKNSFLNVIKESIYQDVGSLVSLSLAQYKITKSIKEALSVSTYDGSLKSFYFDFDQYKNYQSELEQFYLKMSSEFNEENIFNFYKKAFELANELDKENPYQRGIDLSARIVNVSSIEYQFKDYSIYQFFYGANKFTSIAEKEISKFKTLKKYYYYDHTDKPRKISDRLWNKRAKDWWAIINRSGSYMSWCPANGGITHDFFCYKDIELNITEMRNYKNTDEENVKILVKESISDELFKKHLALKLEEKGMTMEDYKNSSKYHYSTHAFFKAREEFSEMKQNCDPKIVEKEMEYLQLLKK